MKPRIHNTVRDLETSPEKPIMWARRPEKPIMMWACRTMISLVLVCGSYFIVDIVRTLRAAPEVGAQYAGARYFNDLVVLGVAEKRVLKFAAAFESEVL
jgi:hypothetical protein